jgi:hypothetical protein
MVVLFLYTNQETFKTNLMKKILLSCITFLFCISMMAQNSVSLKLNLEKNKVYRLSAFSDQTITQTINGNQQNIDSRSQATASIKMVDATADFIVAEVRFDTLVSNTNSMGKTNNITSVSEGNIKSTEASEIMSCIMNRLTKNAVYAKIDYTGKVLEVVNAKMISDAVLKDTSSIALTGLAAKAVKSQVQAMVTDKALKTRIEMFTHFLPGKQVSVGDKWSSTENTNAGGMSLDIVTSYHLDGVTGNSANITAESEVKAPVNAAPMVSGGATIVYDDLKGMSKLTMTVDTRTGLIIEENGKTHIAGNLGVSGTGFSMQIPMDINGTTKVIALQ